MMGSSDNMKKRENKKSKKTDKKKKTAEAGNENCIKNGGKSARVELAGRDKSNMSKEKNLVSSLKKSDQKEDSAESKGTSKSRNKQKEKRVKRKDDKSKEDQPNVKRKEKIGTKKDLLPPVYPDKKVEVNKQQTVEPKGKNWRKKMHKQRSKRSPSTSSSNTSDRNTSESEDSDLDLTKDVHSMSHYMDDPKTMVGEMFRTVGRKQVLALLPNILTDIPVDELQRLCVEQLEIMSRKRIQCTIEGKEMMSSSSSEDEEEETVGDGEGVDKSPNVDHVQNDVAMDIGEGEPEGNEPGNDGDRAKCDGGVHRLSPVNLDLDLDEIEQIVTGPVKVVSPRKKRAKARISPGRRRRAIKALQPQSVIQQPQHSGDRHKSHQPSPEHDGQKQSPVEETDTREARTSRRPYRRLRVSGARSSSSCSTCTGGDSSGEEDGMMRLPKAFRVRNRSSEEESCQVDPNDIDGIVANILCHRPSASSTYSGDDSDSSHSSELSYCRQDENRDGDEVEAGGDGGGDGGGRDGDGGGDGGRRDSDGGGGGCGDEMYCNDLDAFDKMQVSQGLENIVVTIEATIGREDEEGSEEGEIVGDEVGEVDEVDESEYEKTQLELLELELKARALRALLQDRGDAAGLGIGDASDTEGNRDPEGNHHQSHRTKY